jgi:uncharacterized membrane protein
MTEPAAVVSKQEAQRRADRIASFRAEMDDLEREGVLALAPEQRAAVRERHEGLLRELAERFDVDVAEGEKQLSLGMRVASFLGALALAASAVLFFRRFWGQLTTPEQVAILTAAPVLGLLATEFAARRERTGYFAALLGLVTFACFLLDLSVLGDIFSVTPSPNAFLAWGAFAALLGYAYGSRLLLGGGLVLLGIWISAGVASLGGYDWTTVELRPETCLPAGLLLFLVPLARPHRRQPELEPVYRLAGLLFGLVPVLILATEGSASSLPWPQDSVKSFYQIAGFVLSAGVIALGIRRHWRDAVYSGAAFFVVFLFLKLVDWWWDWMPRYLFFFLLGLIATGALLVLRRLRNTMVSEVTA